MIPSAAGTPIDAANLYRRVFVPTAKAAGVPWATFHTLRHTCATMHAASFTMDVYVHLLPDDLPEPTFLDGLTAGAGTAAETGRLRPLAAVGQ
ncbi:hypothetical protein BH18ACT12_BH18ACT12_00790 [soil metagenome]